MGTRIDSSWGSIEQHIEVSDHFDSSGDLGIEFHVFYGAGNSFNVRDAVWLDRAGVKKLRKLLKKALNK